MPSPPHSQAERELQRLQVEARTLASRLLDLLARWELAPRTAPSVKAEEGRGEEADERRTGRDEEAEEEGYVPVAEVRALAALVLRLIPPCTPIYAALALSHQPRLPRCLL